MTQYVLVAALVITSELAGSDLDAGLAMTYSKLVQFYVDFAGRLIDGFNKRIVLLISTALFFIMGLFNFTTSLEYCFRTTWVTWCCVALGTTVMATLAVLVLPLVEKVRELICCYLFKI